MVGTRLTAERAPECGQTQWRFGEPPVPGEDALGVLGKGCIPHQVDAKMYCMNTTTVPSAGSPDGKSVNSNPVHHAYYTELANRSAAQSHGKAPMSPDDTFEGRAARQTVPHTRGGGAPALDRQGQTPSLKRGSLSISDSGFDHSNTTAGSSRRRIGGPDHANNADSRAPVHTSALMKRKWCQVHQVPTAENGGSKAAPPPAPELDISIHFDLGALGDVLISARQDDSVWALATFALETVVLPQRVTATMIMSTCELYDDGGCKYVLSYFPTGLAVAAAGLTLGAKVFVPGHPCINISSFGLPAVFPLHFSLISCFDPSLGHIKSPTAHHRQGLDPRTPLIGRGDTCDVGRSPTRKAELLSMDILILGGSARHSAWRRIEEDTSRGFVEPGLQQALAAARQTFLRDLKQTEHTGTKMPSVAVPRTVRRYAGAQCISPHAHVSTASRRRHLPPQRFRCLPSAQDKSFNARCHSEKTNSSTCVVHR